MWSWGASLELGCRVCESASLELELGCASLVSRKKTACLPACPTSQPASGVLDVPSAQGKTGRSISLAT